MVRTRWGVLLALVLWATAAQAQSDLARAKGHYKAGAAHYQRGKYAEAIREFEASYQLSRRPDILYNLAQCHDKLGDVEKTVDYLRRYLQDQPKAGDREQVSAWLANREKALAEQRAAATRAETERQAAEQRARDAEAAARTARQAAVGATAPPPKPRRSTAGWAVPAATAGAAVVLFAVGGAYGGIAMNKKDDASRNCGPGDVCTPEGVKQRSDAISAANVATGFFIAGGVALIAAGTLWFLLRPRAEAPVRVVAGVGPRGTALALQGVW
jgi:tetratricopeptide (TPR) repeat protein